MEYYLSLSRQQIVDIINAVTDESNPIYKLKTEKLGNF